MIEIRITEYSGVPVKNQITIAKIANTKKNKSILFFLLIPYLKDNVKMKKHNKKPNNIIKKENPKSV